MLLLFNFGTGGVLKKFWKLKIKIPQFEAENDILTPDGQQILVGSSLNQVLVLGVGFNNWHLKEKLVQ